MAYNGHGGALWVADLATGARTRISRDRQSGTSGWLPGDERIVVSSNVSRRLGDLHRWHQRHEELKPLLKKPFTQHPAGCDARRHGRLSWSDIRSPASGSLDVMPDGKTSPLVVTPFNESRRVYLPGRPIRGLRFRRIGGRNEVYALPMSGKGERVHGLDRGRHGPRLVARWPRAVLSRRRRSHERCT